MKTPKFMVCKHCGNLVYMVKDAGVKMMCCGQPMEELKANTTDGATEKHVPVVTVNGNEVKVSVGSAEHPMEEAHYITWIYVETKKGGQIKYLNPNEKPEAVFTVIDDEVVAVYEYCNLHGLWKKEI